MIQNKEKRLFASSIKEDKEAIKQKRLAYLKEHEKEIVDFMAKVRKSNPFKYIGMKLSGE